MGKWERRAELAGIRHTEAKAKKESRKNKLPNCESVLTKLINYSYSELESCILVWLESINKKSVCKKYFRTDVCTSKKCRFSHDCVSIASQMRGIKMSDEEDLEILCEDGISIYDISPDDYTRVRFISVNGTCVFDFSDIGIWLNYSNERDKQIKLKDEPLPSLREEEESDEEEFTSDENPPIEVISSFPKTAVETGELIATPFTNLVEAHNYLTSKQDGLSILCPTGFGLVVQFLNHFSLTCFLQCGRSTKDAYLYFDIFRRRRKEYLSSLAMAINKMNKEEKKKKKANMKLNAKKDSYGAKYCGGGGGR